MTLKHIYLFRHGETDWNKSGGYFHGSKDVTLNERGYAQARALISSLSGVNMQCIYTSPLKRASETALVVSEAFSIPLLIKDELREGEVGDASYLTKEEFHTKYDQHFMKRWKSVHPDDENIAFEGAETKGQLRERAIKAMMDLVQETTADVFGVASHGGILRQFISGIGFDQEEHYADIKNAEIIYLTYHPDLQKWSFIERIKNVEA